MQIINLGNIPFLHLSGRFVAVDQIVSIVPSFKHGGSMIFVRGSDKAILVDESTEELAESLTQSSLPIWNQ